MSPEVIANLNACNMSYAIRVAGSLFSDVASLALLQCSKCICYNSTQKAPYLSVRRRFIIRHRGSILGFPPHLRAFMLICSTRSLSTSARASFEAASTASKAAPSLFLVCPMEEEGKTEGRAISHPKQSLISLLVLP